VSDRFQPRELLIGDGMLKKVLVLDDNFFPVLLDDFKMLWIFAKAEAARKVGMDEAPRRG